MKELTEELTLMKSNKIVMNQDNRISNSGQISNSKHESRIFLVRGNHGKYDPEIIHRQISENTQIDEVPKCSYKAKQTIMKHKLCKIAMTSAITYRV